MGLFSRKSPEEKRLNKFNKTEKRVNKTIKAVNCPIYDLYLISANEEEYLKICNYFKQWVSSYLEVALPKIKMWGDERFWHSFTVNCINGLLSFMVIGQYEECLKYSDIILSYEDIILEKKIGRGNAGGLIGVTKLAAAAAGVGGNKKQVEFIEKLKFIKAIALHELGKHGQVETLLKNYESDYGWVFKKDDEYFNNNFKYTDPVRVSDLRK